MGLRDHLQLDRYRIPKGSDADDIRGEPIWECVGKFKPYALPNLPAPACARPLLHPASHAACRVSLFSGSFAD